MRKPEPCLSCPFAKYSTGFCADYFPAEPKLAIVLKMAGKDEVISGSPMTGKAGRFWEYEYLRPLGIERKDVIICNVIRCYPNGGVFPTGKMKESAIVACEHWNHLIEMFQPNLWIVTFNPASVMRTPQQGKLLKRAFELMWQKVAEGYKPVVLAGEEARELYAPWLKGQMKKWQRTHWET